MKSLKEVHFIYGPSDGKVYVDHELYSYGEQWAEPQAVAELLLWAGVPVRLNGTLLEAYDERV